MRTWLQEGLIGSQLAIPHENRSRWSCQRGRQAEADVLKAVPIVRMMGMNEQIDSTIVPQR